MSPRRAVALATALTAVVAVGAVTVVRVPVHWAVLLALPVGAVALVGGLVAGNPDTFWAPEPEPPAGKVTARATFLTERLENAASDPAGFVTRVQPRLRHIAAAALHRDPEDAAEELGAELHHLLTAPDARLPSPRRFAALVRRLEDLC